MNYSVPSISWNELLKKKHKTKSDTQQLQTMDYARVFTICIGTYKTATEIDCRSAIFTQPENVIADQKDGWRMTHAWHAMCTLIGKDWILDICCDWKCNDYARLLNEFTDLIDIIHNWHNIKTSMQDEKYWHDNLRHNVNWPCRTGRSIPRNMSSHMITRIPGWRDWI